VTGLDELFGAALEIPAVIPPDEAAAVRDRLEHRGYTRYAQIDRGHYEFVDAPEEPALCARLLALAGRLVGRTLTGTRARAIRFGPGDYLLAHADPPHEDRPFELVLDLSPSPVPAELHYRRRGQVYFRFACVPGSLAIVERGPTVTSNHTYVSKRFATASVVRLVLLARSL
jgi:hypothetical protein